jgi:hypothetical protein
MNGRLKWVLCSAKEDREMIARDRTEFASSMQPADFETQRVAVMLLRPLDVLDWKLRRRRPKGRSQALLIHLFRIVTSRDRGHHAVDQFRESAL